MGLSVLTNPQKIARVRETLQAEYARREAAQGKLVRYEMPPVSQPFTRLADAIARSSRRRLFLGTEYLVDYGDGLRQLIPAVEYYKVAFGAAAEKLDALGHAQQRVRQIQQTIEDRYRKTRELMPVSKQPSVTFESEIYTLKNEIAGALFVTASLLETLTTTLPFLYASDPGAFWSFPTYVSNLKKTTQDAVLDPAMLAYVTGPAMEWWHATNAYRKHLAHTGVVQVSFRELQPGQVTTLLQNDRRPEELMGRLVAGADSFCGFFNNHFGAMMEATA